MDKFDPSNRKYRCFCGGCHVTTATLILCLISISLVVVAAGAIVSKHPKMASLTFLLVFLLLSTLLTPFYAVNNNKNYRWMLPVIAVTTLILIGVVYENLTDLNALLTYGKKSRFYPFDREPENDFFGFLGFAIIKALLTIGFNVWCLVIFIRTYQYLAAKTKAELLPTHE